MRTNNRFLVPIILLVTTGFLAACQTQATLVPNSAQGIGVMISSDMCPNIEAKMGQQVTWTNTDSQEHIVRHRPEEGDALFDSGELQQGDSFSFVFIEPGTFLYECSEGGGADGIVVVQP